jgi:hypothetical protein
MKIAALSIILIAAASSAAGAIGGAPPAVRKVTVCMESGPGDFGRARMMTASLFARIGVTLEWYEWSRCPSEALRIGLSDKTPEDLRPGALAYAVPFEGTHIRVFWDRVQAGACGSRVTALLAYVLAHEITHMLQGCTRHSATGVMKAQWDPADVERMARMELPFTADDIDLIYGGMDQRDAGKRPAKQDQGGREAVQE